MKLSMQYGYIRVSSKEQNEERQYIAMREFGIQNENIILDKQSGKNFERPGYIQLTGKLKPGDTLVIRLHSTTPNPLKYKENR